MAAQPASDEKKEVDFSFDLDAADEAGTNGVTLIQPGQTIRVQGKDQVASTGATWQYQIVSQNGCIISIYKNLELISTDYKPATNGLIGAPGTKVFTFKLGEDVTDRRDEKFRIEFKKVSVWDHDDDHLMFSQAQSVYEFTVQK